MPSRDHDRRRDGRRDPPRDDPAPREAAEAADAVLALQRSAGNQAVGAFLARAPKDDQRRPDRGEGPKDRAEVTLGDIGPIPVLGVQLPSRTRGGGPGGGRRGEEPYGGEVVVTAKYGPHSTAIARANVEGRAMDGTIEFAGGVRVELAKAMVTSYQVSTAGDGGTETWTLDAHGVKLVTPEPDYGP